MSKSAKRKYRQHLANLMKEAGAVETWDQAAIAYPLTIKTYKDFVQGRIGYKQAVTQLECLYRYDDDAAADFMYDVNGAALKMGMSQGELFRDIHLWQQ